MTTALRITTLSVPLLLLPVLATAQFREPTHVLHTFTGENVGDNFGWVSSPLDDIDGDGANEVIITATGHDAGGANAGRVYVYSTGSGALLYSLDGTGAGAQLGWSARAAGDLDGDGFADVIAGAPGTAANPGRAVAFSAKRRTVLWSLTRGPAAARFGASVTGIGDVDGDRVPDVVIAAPFDAAGGSGAGRADVVSGADGSTVLWTVTGVAGAQLGTALGDLGDLNGDGVHELGVGAQNANGGRGLAYVYDIRNRVRLFTLTPDATATSFGLFFIATPGDVNGDGTGDIYVGDFGDNQNGNAAGKAYVFDGKTGSRIWVIPGTRANEGFGIGRGAGDVDGDGRADLLLCGWTDSSGAVRAGKGTVFSGRDLSVLRTYTSTTAGENFGFDAHGIGDVDGDGRLDQFVTAATFGGSRGRCYLISGCDGSYEALGTPVAGSGGLVPLVETSGCPSPRLRAVLDVRQGLGNAPGALFLGARQVSIPIGAGILIASPDVLVAHQLTGNGAGNGTAHFDFAVPSDAAGAVAFVQMLYLDAGANSGFSMTRAVKMTFR